LDSGIDIITYYFNYLVISSMNALCFVL